MLAGCGSQPIGLPGNSGTSAINRILSEAFATTGFRAAERTAYTPEYKVSDPLLYIANVNVDYSSVTIYDAKVNNPNPIAVITAGLSEPGGDCIDSDGTLYVTNEPGSSLGWVSEYALGKTKPVRVITTGINIPAECTIDHQGNLWVTNLGGPTVTEYLKGSTEPHTTLKNGLTYPTGIAMTTPGTSTSAIMVGAAATQTS
jgi:hypothetical protein